jgi:hypothetical protein
MPTNKSPHRTTSPTRGHSKPKSSNPDQKAVATPQQPVPPKVREKKDKPSIHVHFTDPNPYPASPAPKITAPDHFTLVLPAPISSSKTLSNFEITAISRERCERIWNLHMEHMFAKIRGADNWGWVNDVLCGQLLDFFYCFLPM